MVLRMEQGEEIEKYILVKNVNDIPLTIDLIAAGELADEVKLKENSFVLYPKEEKRAYFTITAAKSGTTETKINVKFTPEEGNGIGLSSSIIIITPGEDSEEDSEDTENPSTDSPITGNAISDNLPKISKTTILIVLSAVLILALLALIIYSINKKKKKVRRSNA